MHTLSFAQFRNSLKRLTFNYLKKKYEDWDSNPGPIG